MADTQVGNRSSRSIRIAIRLSIQNRLGLRGEGTKGKGTHDPAKFLPQLPDVRVKPQWTTPRPPLFVPGKSKLNEIATENERFLQELVERNDGMNLGSPVMTSCFV